MANFDDLQELIFLFERMPGIELIELFKATAIDQNDPEAVKRAELVTKLMNYAWAVDYDNIQTKIRREVLKLQRNLFMSEYKRIEGALSFMLRSSEELVPLQEQKEDLVQSASAIAKLIDS